LHVLIFGHIVFINQLVIHVYSVPVLCRMSPFSFARVRMSHLVAPQIIASHLKMPGA
jgi:hypothetical protein